LPSARSASACGVKSSRGHRHRRGLAERLVRAASEQRVQLGARRLDVQRLEREIGRDVRQLALRAQQVGLRGAAGRVALLGDAREALHQLLLAVQDREALVRLPERRVRDLHVGDDLQLDARRVVRLALGLVGRDVAGEAALARERQLLRDAEDVVVGAVHAQRVGDVPRLPAEGRVVERRHLLGDRRHGERAVSRGLDLGVLPLRLGDEVVEDERLSGTRLRRRAEQHAAEQRGSEHGPMVPGHPPLPAGRVGAGLVREYDPDAAA
jgi:hypothetical protein